MAVRRMLHSFLHSRRGIVVLLLGVKLGALALLAYLAVSIADDAVRDRVRGGMRANASISALYIHEQLRGLSEVNASFAGRGLFIRALAHGDERRYDHPYIRRILEQLHRVRPGIGTAFVADKRGVLIDIVPPTPSIVGKDFAFRDWYKGVTRTNRPYVSEAYISQAAGKPLVVAVAAPVWDERADGTRGKRIGILVTAYRVDTIQAFSRRFARAQGVSLEVTDQRGVAVGGPRSAPRRLISLRSDPVVRAGLAGRGGLVETSKSVSAYAPVPELGWTVSATVPASRAFADVHRLRRTVLLVAVLLALVLGASTLLLDRVLRERQLAFGRVRRLADVNRAVLDATPDGIALVDLDGNRLVENSALSALRGDAEVPNETAYEAAERSAEGMADPESFRTLMRACADNPEFQTEAEFETAEGERSFRLFTAPVAGDSGEPFARIFVLRDVTAEREVGKLKSELVATVSHELRTPLTGILGFAELARQRDLDPESRDRFLATIHTEAQRLTTLVDDFLDVQRIEAGGFTLAVAPLDLRTLLTEQAELFGPSAGHTIDLELPDEPLVVAGDAQRIGQVVGNLISNAVKYSPDGGDVTVTAELAGTSVRIAVRDRGLGIPADQQGQIFTKFFRVDSSDTRRIGGTGLGLALCREIVEAHGGRIGFESVQDAGSTFWFELPAGRPATNGTPDSPRVLVIQDDPEAAALLVEWLGGEGYTVEVAASDEEGLSQARRDPPAVVCLDIGASENIDGWHVLSELKATPSTGHVPVVVCSSSNGSSEAVALGAADFLAKPFSSEQLHATIERVLPKMRGSVLVVDDDETVRRLVTETLRGNGFEFREAADGEEALAAIAERRPDAIVLDLVMPGIDGFTVLEDLQANPETRALPVVVLTGHRLTAAERKFLNERAVWLLSKSAYSAHELRRLIAAAVGRSRS